MISALSAQPHAIDTDVYRITPEGYTRWKFPSAPSDLPPRALLLAALPENRIVYVNSHILAQWYGTAWQSYRFERVTLSTAALEPAGRLWAYAGYDGLLHFDLMQMFP